MNDESVRLLEKARRSLWAARVLLREGEPEFAAGRAYYAMFYAAQAVLLGRGLRFRKHSGVHAAFGEHPAKGGLIEQKYHRWLLDSFDKRREGDYGINASLNHEEAEELIEQGMEFINAMEKFLNRP
ncbi:MAG: HEPN domain-containing protein [Candidatus Omnitrophica bacterium]|nr:HEPN domain-containing protein [Candidatus Omnitrophota bacterium]